MQVVNFEEGNGQDYETINVSRSSNYNGFNLVKVRPRNQNVDSPLNTTYENPVNIDSYDSPCFTSNIGNAHHGRARINDMYENGHEGVGLSKAKIFEAIRDIEFEKKKKEKFHIGCFAFSCLLFLTFLSLASSAFLFYKMKTDVMCTNTCTSSASSKKILSETKQEKKGNIKTETNTSNIDNLSKKIETLYTKLGALKALAVLNNTNSSFHDDLNEAMKKIEITFDNKVSNIRTKLEQTNDEISKIHTLLTTFGTWSKNLQQLNSTILNEKQQFSQKLNTVNKTLEKEISRLEDYLAKRSTFQNCTLKKIEKGNDIFKHSDLNDLELNTKKLVARFVILGVTCTARGAGSMPKSNLLIEMDSSKHIIYKCEYEKSDKKSTNITAVIYYWQCPKI